MNVTERFFKYIKINTQSDENNPHCPSTDSQRQMAQLLVEELKKAGADNAYMDEHGYVYASINASEGMEHGRNGGDFQRQ